MNSWPKSSIHKWLILAALTVTAAVLSLGIGSVTVPLQQVLEALAGLDRTSAGAKIVIFTRLPRTCAALLAGSALAVAGAVIQRVLHNPLASPGVMGINSGAGLAVALVCAISPLAQSWTPVVAFLGAMAGVLLVLGLSQYTGASRMTVVLAGVAISNLFSAGIDGVVSLVPEALSGVSDFRIGGFSGVTMARLVPAAIIMAVAMVGIFAMTIQMDVLALGSDTAKSLGLNVSLVRLVLLILAAALAGGAVSFGGLLGFVGLIVPHAIRRIFGEESLPLVAGSALGGGLFVTVCDLAARTLFAPYELPVGVVLSFAGAPFFLWLLFRQRGGKA